jgi:DNA-binding NarL/FixJ family response regulator
MVNAKIRILIADDHPVIVEGLVQMLNRENDMSVIGEVTICLSFAMMTG